ncbi:MAG: GNAT family N-acetyltransferase [Alteromonadaceae bacterium]|nr:GNAT family N-acetyltransferase [Alteromonadaceae bacterium]
MAASSPIIYRLAFGEGPKNKDVFSRSINWDRILLLKSGSDLVGYLQFYQDGVGPHDVSFADVKAVFGLWSSWLRYIVYKLIKRRFDRRGTYLYHITIAKPYRGQGAGNFLTKAWLDFLRSRGVRSASLEVWEKNTPAIKCYESLGFRIVKRTSFKYLNRFNFIGDKALLTMENGDI